MNTVSTYNETAFFAACSDFRFAITPSNKYEAAERAARLTRSADIRAEFLKQAASWRKTEAELLA